MPTSQTRYSDALAAIKTNNSTFLANSVEQGSINGKVELSCLLNQTVMETKDGSCRSEIIDYLLSKGAAFAEAPKTEEFGVSSGQPSSGTSLQDMVTGGTKVTCHRSKNLTILLKSKCDSDATKAVQRLDPIEAGKALDAYLLEAGAGSTAATTAIGFVPSIQKNLKTLCTASNTAACEVEGTLNRSAEQHQEATRRADELNEKQKQEAAAKVAQVEAKKAEEARLQQVELEKQEADQKYQNSPMGQACSAYQSLQSINQAMARERKVAETSGFISKTAMHELGTAKVFGEEGLVKLKQKVRESTGHDFNPKNCK